MPHKLDDIDISILKSLFKDGRKSFRQISKEVNVTSPTVKVRYQRLVNLGFIKSISPDLDMSKIDKKFQKMIKQESVSKTSKSILDKEISINVSCDYCDKPISDNPTVLKFAEFERFFCCTSCRLLYKEKHGGRIHSLIKSSE